MRILVVMTLASAMFSPPATLRFSMLLWAVVCLKQPCCAKFNCTTIDSVTDSEQRASRFNLSFIFLSSRLRTSGNIPVVDIALEMIADSGILEDYTLRYTAALDSQVYSYSLLWFAAVQCCALRE